MTGIELYELYRQKLIQRGGVTVLWKDRTPLYQAAWNALAADVQLR